MFSEKRAAKWEIDAHSARQGEHWSLPLRQRNGDGPTTHRKISFAEAELAGAAPAR